MVIIRYILIGFVFFVFFRKPTRPSLPLKKAPPLFSVFFNSLYDPFGFPLVGDRNLRGKEETAPPSLLTASL